MNTFQQMTIEAVSSDQNGNFITIFVNLVGEGRFMLKTGHNLSFGLFS